MLNVNVYSDWSSARSYVQLVLMRVRTERKKIFQINTTGLKLPSGGRQTNWLFTNMAEELN